MSLAVANMRNIFEKAKGKGYFCRKEKVCNYYIMNTEQEIKKINKDIDCMAIQINFILKLIIASCICFLLGLIVGCLI